MFEHLLNLKEAANYLGLDEPKLKELVRKRMIPAYRIGGSYLRFRKDQLDYARSSFREPARQNLNIHSGHIEETQSERMQDFLYFNDFYIISAVLMLIVVIAVFAT